MAKKIKPQQLYWCITKGHEEDWFIQAISQKEAQKVHACGEGFNLDYAKAKYICDIPLEFCEKEPCWPMSETLIALGFEYLQEGSPRRVRRNGVVYTEGTYFTSVLLTWDQFKQPTLYLLHARTTTKFKIGYTTNLENRIKQLSSTNPFYLDIMEHLNHPDAKKWEYALKKIFIDYRTNNEWFDFDDDGQVKLRKEFDKYRKICVDYSKEND